MEPSRVGSLLVSNMAVRTPFSCDASTQGRQERHRHARQGHHTVWRDPDGTRQRSELDDLRPWAFTTPPHRRFGIIRDSASVTPERVICAGSNVQLWMMGFANIRRSGSPVGASFHAL